MIRFEDEHEMWHTPLGQRTTGARTFIGPFEFVTSKRGMTTTNSVQHYESTCTKEHAAFNKSWPNFHSYNPFSNNVNDKLCTECKTMSWTVVPVVECNLRNHWLHSGDENDCVKHCGVIDCNELEGIFVCKTCIKTLIAFHKRVFNDTKVDRMMTVLNSFNIEGTDVKERHLVDELKFVLSNCIDEQR